MFLQGVMPLPREEPPTYVNAGRIMECLSRIRRERQRAKSSLCELLSCLRPIRALADSKVERSSQPQPSKGGAPRAEAFGDDRIEQWKESTSLLMKCNLLFPKQVSIKHNRLSQASLSFTQFVVESRSQ
jgi:hypothetical protein